MSESQTPEEVAAEVRTDITRAAAVPRSVTAAVDYLVEDDQLLVAWHVLRGYGASESQALSVFEKSGIGAEVLDLLLVSDLLEDRSTFSEHIVGRNM